LKFDIFLLIFCKKGCFLSFECAKWSFTIFGPSGKTLGYTPGNPCDAHAWVPHIQNLSKKLARAMGIIRTIKKLAIPAILFSIYYSLV